jgi:hypothetical protein
VYATAGPIRFNNPLATGSLYNVCHKNVRHKNAASYKAFDVVNSLGRTKQANQSNFFYEPVAALLCPNP